jgi:hypothetical protein
LVIWAIKLIDTIFMASVRLEFVSIFPGIAGMVIFCLSAARRGGSIKEDGYSD